MLSEHRNLKAV